MTGTYDAPSGTVFWTTGNPSPDYDSYVRTSATICTRIAYWRWTRKPEHTNGTSNSLRTIRTIGTQTKRPY